MPQESDLRFACAECGSPNVEGSAWYRLNTEKLSDTQGPVDYLYCPDCDQEFVDIVDWSLNAPEDPWRHIDA